VFCTKWKHSFHILALAIFSSKGVNNLYNTRTIAEWTRQKYYIKAVSSQPLLFTPPNISMYPFILILYLFPSSLPNIFKSHFLNPISNTQLSIPTHAQLQRHRLQFIKNHLRTPTCFGLRPSSGSYNVLAKITIIWPQLDVF